MSTAAPARSTRVSTAPQPHRGSGAGARVVVHLAVGVTCVVVALLAAWVSRGVWHLGDLTVPWGMALAVAASAAAVWLAKAWAPGAGFAAAAGWVVGIAYVLPGGPGGDLIVINDSYGNGFLLLASVAVIGTACWGSWRR